MKFSALTAELLISDDGYCVNCESFRVYYNMVAHWYWARAMSCHLDTVIGFLTVPVQKSDPVHGHGYGTGVFPHFPFQDIGTRCVQHVAVTVVYLREKDGLVDAGGIFKGDELHGIILLSPHGLSGDIPTDGGHLFAYFCMKVLGVDISRPLRAWR